MRNTNDRVMQGPQIEVGMTEERLRKLVRKRYHHQHDRKQGQEQGSFLGTAGSRKSAEKFWLHRNKDSFH